MFIGHFAPAFAAGAISPESPRLGTLFVAAQLVDWAFFLFVLVGIEEMRIVPGITAMNPLDLHYMPYTHTLAGTAVFALVFGVIVWRMSRNAVAGVWAGLVTLSHWLTDLLVHRPDLTLAGGPERLGLGLWDRPMIAIPLELAITLLAFAWYIRATKGPVGPPLVLIGAMLLLQAITWFAPEPTVMSVWLPITALVAFAILTMLATWVGRTRWHKRQTGLAVASARG